MNNRSTRKPKKKIQPKEIALTIEEIGAGGDGVGMYNGKSVYIPKAAAGDVLTVRVVEGKDDYKGDILSVQTPSPERVSAPCPHYEACGGCALQHIGEDVYRAWKIAKVKTTLERTGVTPRTWEEPVFLPPATRRRTTFAVLKTNDKNLILGYHAPRSHAITDIASCLILDPVLDKLIKTMRPYLLRLAPLRKTVDVTLQNAGGLDVVLTGEWQDRRIFTLEQNEALAAMANDLDMARISMRAHEHAPCEILLSHKPVLKTFGSLSVPLPPTAFLQASDAGEKALGEIVLRHAQEATHVADLFCGCGTFSGKLLQAEKSVLAIDSDQAAIQALGGCKNPKLVARKQNLFKEPVALREFESLNIDTIVIDPPRAGAKEQMDILAQSTIPRIISVSCNPATFARDARILQEGGYTLQSLTLVDQFVWSPHVELVALFQKM